MTGITLYQGLVARHQADASGHLETACAAAVLIDAFHIFSALSDPSDAAAGPNVHPAAVRPELVSLQRMGDAPPRVGEILRCVLEARVAEDAPDIVKLSLAGEHGAAWTGTVRCSAVVGGDRTWRVLAPAQAGLPPAFLLRRMHGADCDQAGHVNVQVFLGLVDDAIGVWCRELAPEGAALHVVQARISFKSELFCGDAVSVHGGIHAFDAQGVNMVHGIFHQPSGRLACVVESRLAALDAGGQVTDHRWDPAWVGAASIQQWPALPRARPLAPPRVDRAPPAASVPTCQSVVDAWDADNAGYLQTRALVNLCSTGARQYLAWIGLDKARFMRDQSTVAAIDYAMEIHRRPALGCNLSMRSSHLSASSKVIRFSHYLLDSQSGAVYATIDIVGVMLDLATHRSTELPADIRARLETLAKPDA